METIRDLYISYKQVVERFKEETIEQRFDIFLSMINSFIESTCPNHRDKIVVNDFILMHSLLCYYSDVKRLMDFHHVENVNDYKIIAYESFWLIQRKPIQITINDEELIYINEKFVVSFILDFLTTKCKLDLEQISKHSKKQKHLDAFLASLFYHLKYRTLTAQMLEMFLYSFRAGSVLSNTNTYPDHDSVK